MVLKSYSERGILNSFFYEIYYNSSNINLFNTFLQEIYFPNNNFNYTVKNVTFYLEQSLSQFGDSDIIFLIETENSNKISIFGEAKVKTYGKNKWFLEKEFEEFNKGLKSTLNSSNLFTQLYHKVGFQKATSDDLKNGVPFPNCSTREKRKIGKNEIVNRATQEIKMYNDNAFYLLIVPVNIDTVKEFYKNILCKFKSEIIPDYDVGNYCFLTWESIEKFCQIHQFSHTLRCFEHNRDQIY